METVKLVLTTADGQEVEVEVQKGQDSVKLAQPVMVESVKLPGNFWSG